MFVMHRYWLDGWSKTIVYFPAAPVSPVAPVAPASMNRLSKRVKALRDLVIRVLRLCVCLSQLQGL